MNNDNKKRIKVPSHLITEISKYNPRVTNHIIQLIENDIQAHKAANSNETNNTPQNRY